MGPQETGGRTREASPLFPRLCHRAGLGTPARLCSCPGSSMLLGSIQNDFSRSFLAGPAPNSDSRASASDWLSPGHMTTSQHQGGGQVGVACLGSCP